MDEDATVVVWTAQAKATAASAFEGDAELHRERVQHAALLAANPNFFGQVAGSGFTRQSTLSFNTTYESLCSVGYSPARRRLEATVEVRQPRGYGGTLCSAGTREYVRFFVDTGSGFVDAGVAAASVHDIANGKDCAGSADHPLSYTVGVPYDPPRNLCDEPQLPLVRAILSWQTTPTAGDPDFPVAWGDRRDVHIQIPARPPLPSDLTKLLDTPPKWLVTLAEVELPTDVPPPLTVAQLVHRYDKSSVPPHRYALPHAAPALASAQPQLVAGTAQTFAKAGIDWAALAAAVAALGSNTEYEQLTCVGLDNNTDQLVATFEVKQPYGYNGNPCGAGSTEYVAFWADWGPGGDCEFTYLGTVPVTVHDFDPMPSGKLWYSAVLPVDLSKVRRPCSQAAVHRVRAVLSWAAAPSTTDPDAAPHWGNAVTAHVQVSPGVPLTGPAITVVGGVPVVWIEQSAVGTGMTTPDARFRLTNTSVDGGLGRGCPFADTIAVEGAGLPEGQLYRLLARNVTANTAPAPLMTPFLGSDHWGNPVTVTPGPAGWTPTTGWGSDIMLGIFPGYAGNDLWEISLETAGGNPTPVKILLDNTLKTVDTAAGDPDNTADLEIDGGDCKVFNQGRTITGTVIARDAHLASWGLATLPPQPAGTAAGVGVPTPGGDTNQTPLTGITWSLDTTHMRVCSYVMELVVVDRTIINSGPSRRSVAIYRGFGVDA